jgi:Domain of unknown function (DUF5916)
MLTSTHRWANDRAVAFQPAQATTGGLDFTRHFGNRAWAVEASGIVSHVTGEPEAIRELQTNAVHYYQRPDADHLGVDPARTSLTGHGGMVRFGRSESSRLRLLDHFHWYSPGLDLNDIGYLRQADLLANQVFLGWSETTPKGIFRSYSAQLAREDQWDFGGLATRSSTEIEASGQFENKWHAEAQFSYDDVVDTRMLRGGPALRWHDFFEASVHGTTDDSRRVSVAVFAEHSWARDDDSTASGLSGHLDVRLSNRLSLAGEASYERLLDNLQYVATADTAGGTRWVLGRIDQDTWGFTVRVNLSITPDLTVQYYGSPFIGTGRYTAFKRATDTLASANADRFHLYGLDEIAYLPETNSYRVAESGGGPVYAFGNPDFSFRQFRSNLVARWEWKPGSSVYVVWSQGRTGSVPYWDDSFGDNWSELWGTRPDNVFLVKLSYWFSP